MAIDTREKRQSAAHIGMEHWFGADVTPNVAKDAGWRQQVAYSYSGIAADSPVAATGMPSPLALPLMGVG